MADDLEHLSCSELANFLREKGIDEEIVLKFEGEGICGEVLPLSMTELMQLAPRIGPRRILQKRIPKVLGTVMSSNPASMTFSSSDDLFESSQAPGLSSGSQESLAASSFDSNDSVCDHDSDDGETADGARSSTAGPLSYPCQTPKFTKVVAKALAQGDIYKEWDQFIREAAVYYVSYIPDSSDGMARITYHNIGRTIFEKYPCIKSNGQNAWSHFNKCLSSKIRWERQKRKGKTTKRKGQDSVSSAAKRAVVIPSTPGTDMSEDEYRQCTMKIMEFFTPVTSLTTAKCTSIQRLLAESFSMRRKQITSPSTVDSSDALTKTWADFPFFAKEEFLLQEMKLCDSAAVEYYNKNYRHVLDKIATALDESHVRQQDILQKVDKHLNKRLKNVELVKQVEIQGVTPAADTIKSLVLRCSAPQMVFTTNTEGEGTPTGAHIIGYGKSLCEITGENIVQRALILLMASYFVSDTHYPPCCNMTLKFVESYFLGRFDPNLPKSVKTFATKAGLEGIEM